MKNKLKSLEHRYPNNRGMQHVLIAHLDEDYLGDTNINIKVGTKSPNDYGGGWGGITIPAGHAEALRNWLNEALQ